MKNIIAFCAGMITGLELGDNTIAAIITKGLSEISKLCIAMGGEQKTIYGLTGLGDLIVTCLSEHSRNRRAGILLGQGKTLDEIREQIGMTIESIDNIEIAYNFYIIEMPVVHEIYKVLFEQKLPEEAISDLMGRKENL